RQEIEALSHVLSTIFQRVGAGGDRLCLQCFDGRITAGRKLVSNHAAHVIFKSELIYDGERAAQVCEHFDPPAIWPIVVTHGRVLLVVRSKRDWRTRAKHTSGRRRRDGFARWQSWTRSRESHRAAVVRGSCLLRDDRRLLSFNRR